MTPPYLGSEAGFYAIASSYVVGDELVWCIYGFEIGVPVEVTVQDADGVVVDRFQVVLDPASPSDCRSVDDECRLDELRHLVVSSTDSPRLFSVKPSTAFGPPAAALGGWILPGTPSGGYVISATQGNVRTTHRLDVRHHDEPGIDVGAWFDASGRKRHTAVLVGFEPGTAIPLALYRLVGSSPPAPWVFHSDLATVEVDEHGEGLWNFELPSGLAPGRYCVLSAETIPPEAGRDPCHYLARFDGSVTVT